MQAAFYSSQNGKRSSVRCERSVPEVKCLVPERSKANVSGKKMCDSREISKLVHKLEKFLSYSVGRGSLLMEKSHSIRQSCRLFILNGLSTRNQQREVEDWHSDLTLSSSKGMRRQFIEGTHESRESWNTGHKNR